MGSKTALAFIIRTKTLETFFNVLFYVPQKKESHTGLKQHEATIITGFYFWGGTNHTHVMSNQKVKMLSD